MIARERLARIGVAAIELLVNFVLPYVFYRLAKPHFGEVHAIMASSAPPIVWSVVGFARNRRLDALSILVLTGIFLSLAVFALGGSPKFLLMRESLITGGIGLLFLGSAAIGRPLIAQLAEASMARGPAHEYETYSTVKNTAGFKRNMRLMTLVWGFGLTGETALRIVLVFSLPVGTYLLVGPFIGYGVYGGLSLWNFLYVREMRRGRRIAQPVEDVL